MKITFLLACIPVLLAATPPKKPKVPRNIIGFWIMTVEVVEDAHGYKHGFYKPVKSKKINDPNIFYHEVSKEWEIHRKSSNKFLWKRVIGI